MTLDLILPLVFFVVASCGTYALLRLLFARDARIQLRMKEVMAGAEVSAVGPSTALKGLADGITRLTSWSAVSSDADSTSRAGIEKRLMKAGLYGQSAVIVFYAARFVLIAAAPAICVVAGILHYLPMDKTLLFGFAGGGLGSLIPGLWLERRIHQRHFAIRRSLPDFLDLMIVCLEGGLSLQETIRRVNEELKLAHPILAHELDIVQRDIEICSSVDQALKRFAARSDFEGVKTLSTFIRESQKFGTQITDALRTHADMLRSQREQYAEEKAQKAAVKILIPTLLLIFPAIFVVLVGPAVIQIKEAFAAQQ